MKTTLITALCTLGLCLQMRTAQAQCDTIVNMCEKYITEEYISDAQTYRALLNGDDVAEFTVTLFAGNTYRLASCSGTSEGQLIFRIVDVEKNILYTSADFSNAPYWDFFVENTLQVTVEAMLDKSKTDSGCAVLLIGFKK
ncbi:MAG: hypothetical protein ACKVOR_02585 [Flavobacteriales bacterium]